MQESTDNVLNFIDICTGALQDDLSRGNIKASTSWDKILAELEERRQRVSGVFRSSKGPAPRAPPEGAPAQPSTDNEPSVKTSDETHACVGEIGTVLQVCKIKNIVRIFNMYSFIC